MDLRRATIATAEGRISLSTLEEKDTETRKRENGARSPLPIALLPLGRDGRGGGGSLFNLASETKGGNDIIYTCMQQYTIPKEGGGGGKKARKAEPMNIYESFPPSLPFSSSLPSAVISAQQLRPAVEEKGNERERASPMIGIGAEERERERERSFMLRSHSVPIGRDGGRAERKRWLCMREEEKEKGG